MAAIPLVIMARHIFDLVSRESRSGSGLSGVVGVYLVLLVLAVVVVVLATGVRLLRRNPLVASYAAAGTRLWVRYGSNAMEVPPATGYTVVPYSQIKDLAFIGGVAFIRPNGGPGFVLPRELVPESGLVLIQAAHPPRSSLVQPSGAKSAPVPRDMRGQIVLVTCAAVVVLVVFAVIAVIDMKPAGSEHGSVPATAADVRTTIAVGSEPYGSLALDSDAKSLYVATPGAEQNSPGSVFVVDIATNRVAATIPLTMNPKSIAVDPGTHSAYVLGSAGADTQGGVFTVIDCSTNTVTGTIPLTGSMPAGLPAMGIAIGTDKRTAFIVNQSKSIELVDLATNKQINSIPLPLAATSITLDPAARKLFVVDTEGMIAVIDPVAMAVVGTIDGRGHEISSIAVDPGANILYISSGREGAIKVVDTIARVVTATLTVPNPEALAVDPTTHNIYAYTSGEISVLQR